MLGQGTIAERNFLGALRRVRVRLPAIPGTRQVAPAVYGEEGLLVDAVLPAETKLARTNVWVSLRGWHILAPSQPRLLVCDLPDEGSPAPLPLVRDLGAPLGAKVCLLAVTADADGVEPLRAALSERAAAAGVVPMPRRWCAAATPRTRSSPSSGRASTTSLSSSSLVAAASRPWSICWRACRRPFWWRRGSRQPSRAS